ncbi:MAG: pilus assembly protein PilM [Gammaproteobacteria bacterium]|nr:pilus assembly protein PilM [Gammaproteobacteria bacterium]
MLSLTRKKQSLVGIDISSAAVKLLEFSKSGSRYKVENYGVAPLPQDVVVDRNIADINVLSEALKAVVKQSGTKVKNAAVAVAGSSVITKVISMPADLNDKEMEEQIEIEADQYIPYSLDEVNLDFTVQGETEDKPDMVDVLLAASRRENVEDRVAALEMAGMKPVIVDVEAYAVENAFSLLEDQIDGYDLDRAVAIVDIGATMTTFHVIHKRRIIYTREQGFGGKQLTEEIQRRYGLSYEEAGLAKKHGGLPDNYSKEVLEPFKDALVQQIGRAFQFFASSNTHRNLEQIILAGGCASIPQVDRAVEQQLKLETAVVNPFLNMRVSNKINSQSLSNDAPTLMIAAGLALRSFD